MPYVALTLLARTWIRTWISVSLFTLSSSPLVPIGLCLRLSQLRIGLLDWGQIKELGREDREKVANLILAVSSHISPDIVKW